MSILRNLLTPPPGTGPADAGAVVERWDPFAFQGNQYYGLARPVSYNGEVTEADFAGFVQAGYKGNGIVFGCMLARMMLFSEVRFAFRRIRRGKTGDLFGNTDLTILEHPWRNGTTGDLLTRMLTDADLAGNFYAVLRPDGSLKRLRPDWVSIVIGSDSDGDIDSSDIDSEVIGYVYQPGGANLGKKPVVLLPEDVVHFAPIQDPMASYRGMSWLTPTLRDLEADTAATVHKAAFFKGGASPRQVVRFAEGTPQAQAMEWADRIDATINGADNAYRTLYIGGGADTSTWGTDLRQLDFKTTQGGGETRIALDSGIHPVILGLSEGLAGSSLNQGNFNAARRLVADKFLRPTWRMACASLANVVPVPADAELWYDSTDVAFLREDYKDRADVQYVKAQTIKQYVEAGFTKQSAVLAADSEDPSLLVEAPVQSVQVQSVPAGPSVSPVPATPALNGSTNGVRQS